MLFSSATFLFYFIPCVLILYFIAPNKLKNTVLLVSSLFFYGWGEPKYLLFMLFSITQGYVFGLLIEKYHSMGRSKVFLAASCILSLGLLGYCKYADFFIQNINIVTGISLPLLRIALPIGISFYTFQILSYVVDVYRGTVAAQRSYIDLAAYISMFPQLIAGPIVRYSDIEQQLKARSHSMEGCALGIRQFVIGLAKKVLLANVLGELVAYYKASPEKSVLFVWLYAVAYALQLYFDFSGYSDMAIGLGRIFGFHFPQNFNYPYISRSITEFWRRWHISLGSWFRDYLYIPLGGNRVSKARWFLNILVVWMATGFWHGAAWNFILWGLIFALLLLGEKLLYGKFLQKSRVLCHVYVVLIVVVTFMIFDASGIGEAMSHLQALVGLSGLPLTTAAAVYSLKSYGVVLLLAMVGATPLLKRVAERVFTQPKAKSALCVLEPVLLLILLIVCTAYLVDGSFNPFLYFRF